VGVEPHPSRPSSKGFSKNSVTPPLIAFTVVGVSPCPVRKTIGGPSLYLLNEFAIPSQSCLDLLDGILIEMVVEEREPGMAVVVIAIDLHRGTILAHSSSFTYVFEDKILAWNNCDE
jgi:hypothetical protein